MRRKKICVRPKLNDRGGNLQQSWYVELSMRNPQTDEMVRKRYFELGDLNINRHHTTEERYSQAKKIINLLDKKIDSGWTIFNDIERYVYDDQLQYSNAAMIYKKQLTENTNYTYWISQYINEKFGDLKSETKSTYKSRYRIFGLWLESRHLDKVDITAINNTVIIDFFTYLKTDRNQSSRTYRSYGDLMRAFFDHLGEKDIIAKNPVHNLPKNRNYKDQGAERIHKVHLTELMKMVDKEDPQLAMACRFEYYCGLRPGYEIRLLKVGDIDFRRGYSKVRVCLDNAKTSRRREVTIPDVFLKYLLEQGIDQYDPDCYVFSKKGMPGTTRLGKNSFRFRFVKFREKLGLPFENKFYSFKHTGAVTLAEEGEKIINIRDHLGHTSISVTEAYLKRHGFNDSNIIRSMAEI